MWIFCSVKYESKVANYTPVKQNIEWKFSDYYFGALRNSHQHTIVKKRLGTHAARSG